MITIRKVGRPPKPADQKYVNIHVKVPPHQAAWLKQQSNQSGKIQELIEKEMTK
jgi:hypothetical protein